MLDLPKRTKGITVAYTNGGESFNPLIGEHIEYLKVLGGVGIVLPDLWGITRLARKHMVEVFLGGTLFEKFYSQGKIRHYKEFLFSKDIKWVEISHGIVDVNLADEIKRFKDWGFGVFAEIGKKDDSVKSAGWWLDKYEQTKEADYVVIEGRLSGDSALYHSDGMARGDVVSSLDVDSRAVDRIIWETPTVRGQAYFINRFGPNVNLGNIPLDKVYEVEAMRLGLKYETWGVGANALT